MHAFVLHFQILLTRAFFFKTMSFLSSPTASASLPFGRLLSRNSFVLFVHTFSIMRCDFSMLCFVMWAVVKLKNRYRRSILNLTVQDTFALRKTLSDPVEYFLLLLQKMNTPKNMCLQPWCARQHPREAEKSIREVIQEYVFDVDDLDDTGRADALDLAPFP